MMKNELHQTDECHIHKILQGLQAKPHAYQLVFLAVPAGQSQPVPGNLLHQPRGNNETLQNRFQGNLPSVPQATRPLGIYKIPAIAQSIQRQQNQVAQI